MSSSMLDSSDTPAVTKSSRLRPVLPVLLGLAIAGTAVGIWQFLSRPTETALRLSGRVEGTPTEVEAKMSGRVESVAVREGDRVNQGQVLVRLADTEITAALQQAEARIVAASQQEQQVRNQIAMIDAQIQSVQQFSAMQPQPDMRGQVESAIAPLKAQLQQAESQLNLATLNRDRYAQLWQEGAIAKQQFDQAQMGYESAQATVTAIKQQIDAVQNSLTAQPAVPNSANRSTALSGLMQQRQQAIAQVQIAQTEIKTAQTARQQIQAKLANLAVPSPLDGVVTARRVEPGMTVGNGKTLLSVTNLDSVYLRGFIPEDKLDKVRVGQQAKVYLDSSPEQPLTAKVAAIDLPAATSPENTRNLGEPVVSVKLTINNLTGYAKPGMPAKAEIILDTKE